MPNICCTCEFSHFSCGMNAGFPAWNAITDDRKLLLGNEDTYAELVQKYGKKVVEDRQKFLSEAGTWQPHN